MSIAAYIWFMTIGGLSSFLLNIWQALLRIVGITLGIGLGLGLAGHVYDVLSDAQLDTSAGAGGVGGGNRDGTVGEDNYNRRSTKTNTSTSNSKPNLKEHNTSLLMEDANSYHSLMRSAGYTVDNGMMRAQMVRGGQAVDVRSANDAKRSLLQKTKVEQDGMLKTVDDAIEPPPQPPPQSRVSIYKFDKGTNASTQMRRMWPNLSPLINDSLAKLTEFVLRDYVSSWYSKVDEHVVYTDPSIGVVDGATTEAVGVEEKELVLSSVNREGSTRPSTAPPSGSESLTKRRQMSVSSTSEVGTVGSTATAATATSSSRGGGFARSASELPTTTTTSTIRPRTSNSMELQSSLTSLSSSTAAAAAADPRIFQSPYAVHSPSNSQNTNQQQPQQQQPQQQRTMVLTTTGTQSSPFIDSLYTAFAYLLGMMATRSSENVNILELLLLHFPHILAQNLRVYREMKQVALEKKRRRIVVEREKWRRGQ
eukprot:scaffold10709_cov78-Skeletonema_dohrnii-CCMP3373.AAC.1